VKSATNILGTITAILTILTGLMTQILGCAVDAAGATVCTGSVLPAKYMAIASAIFGLLTMVAKAARPGGWLHSFFGETAVVVDKPGVGTVTPAQVKTP
jgi:hypothetical protein